jgi:DNA polymerase III sliding clamp (beta) subunit (PCNA family)
MDVPLKILHTVGAASKDPARYQLAGVYFERNGGFSATATDGKQLTTVTWPDTDGGDDYAAIIPIESIKRILKVKDGHHQKVSLPDCLGTDKDTRSRDEAMLLPGADKVTIDAIDGKYPDYRWVCRQTSDNEIRINPFILINQLQTICKALGLSKNDGSTMMLGINDAANPLCLTATADGVLARGYVMPLVADKKK